VRLRFGYADQGGDACFSLDAVRIGTRSAMAAAAAPVTVAAATWSQEGGADNREQVPWGVRAFVTCHS
jgi:hypothetical protein